MLLRHAERIKRQMSWITCYKRAVLKYTWNGSILTAELDLSTSLFMCVFVSISTPPPLLHFSCIIIPFISPTLLLFSPLHPVLHFHRWDAGQQLDNPWKAASGLCSRGRYLIFVSIFQPDELRGATSTSSWQIAH